MGCCCESLKVAGLPNDIPDPPPVCGIRLYSAGVSRSASRFTFVGSGTSQAQLDALHGQMIADNDSAWAEFSSKGFTGGGHTEFYGAVAETVTAGSPKQLWSQAKYGESRDYYLIPLSHTLGGDLLTLEELYGVSQVALSITLRTSRPPVPTNATSPTFFVNEYQNVWTTWDTYWELVDSSLLNFSGATDSSGFPASVRFKPAVAQNGLTDVITNSLSSGVTVPGASSASGVFGEVVLDLSSLAGESGEEWLAILAKTPDGAISQVIVTFSPFDAATVDATPMPGIGQGLVQAASIGPVSNISSRSIAIQEYLILEIWGCILSILVRVDIEQNASSIVEEDRTKNATYLSGTKLTKTFRATDNETIATGVEDDEWLTLTAADNNLWAQPDPSDLDNTTEPFDPPSSVNPVRFEDDDDNEGQIWDLSALTKSYSGLVDIKLYMYAEDIDRDIDALTAAIKVDGSFTADVPISWQAGSNDWKFVTLATDVDPADLANSQLRLTTGALAAARVGQFPAIRVKIEGEAVGGGTAELTRVMDVYLTESGGNYYLTFDYKRQTDPNDSTYYIEPDPPFGHPSHATSIQVGSGTSFETLGDLIGHEFTFTHDGDDNATPANGTEDATVKVTIENISVGQ